MRTRRHVGGVLWWWWAAVSVAEVAAQTNNVPSLEEMSPQPGPSALEVIAAAVVSVWDEEKLRHVFDLRRTLRQSGRHVRDLSALIFPFLNYASVITQAVSNVPFLISALVSAVSAVVAAVGSGLALVGTGIEYGGQATYALGTIIEASSSKVPTGITLAVLIGTWLIVTYPGFYHQFFSTLASAGLGLAGLVASQVRVFVPDHTLWATLLDTFQRFVFTLGTEFFA
ncbi:uncharacterized protein [Cherax quadricarinatus]|nr:uncharacterized protein LOC128695911 isoform X1 [Cherax quadricarinatus]